MTKYGYARISSKKQEANYSLQNQKEQLLRYGILEENIITETASADSFEQPVLTQLLNDLKEGDRLVVTQYDRFARTFLSSLNQLFQLKQKNVFFETLDFNISTETKRTDFFLLIASYLAECEQDIRKSRILEGIEKAKISQKYKGRKAVITEKLLTSIKEYKRKELKNQEIMKLTKISKSTFYKALKTLDLEKGVGNI